VVVGAELGKIKTKPKFAPLFLSSAAITILSLAVF
jgi:hypothetical protein